MSRTAPRANLTPIRDVGGHTIYYDEDRGTYHTWCDDGAHEPVSTAVVVAVSSVLEVAPVDLESLSEFVDPDALNDLLGHWRGADRRVVGAEISFPFSRCTVTVHSSGEIVVDPTQRRRSVAED